MTDSQDQSALGYSIATARQLMQRVRELEEENRMLKDLIVEAASLKPLVPVK